MMNITDIISEAIKEALERSEIDLQNVIEDAVCNMIDQEELADRLLENYDITEMALDILISKC